MSDSKFRITMIKMPMMNMIMPLRMTMLMMLRSEKKITRHGKKLRLIMMMIQMMKRRSKKKMTRPCKERAESMIMILIMI